MTISNFLAHIRLRSKYPNDGQIGNKRLLIYEQRIWSPYREDDDEKSTIFYGTEGMLKLGRGGAALYGPRNEPREIAERPADIPHAHQRNFLDAVRRGQQLNADIEVGIYRQRYLT